MHPGRASARRQARTQVLKCLARACAEEWFAGVAPGWHRGGTGGGTGTIDELAEIVYRGLQKAELEGRLTEQWQEWMRTEHASGSRASPPR